MHYAFVIDACCFLFLMVNIGFASTGFGVFLPHIVAMPGISDFGGSLIVATRTLTSLVAILWVNRYYYHLKCRRGIALACLLVALGFTVHSFASSLPAFLLGAVISGAGYGLGGMVGATTLVNRWFKHGVGTAMGIATMGSGFAGMAVPLVAAQVIEAAGLAAAFRTLAVTALVVGALMYAFLREDPADLGLSPYEGATRVKGGETDGVGGDAAGRTPRTPRLNLAAGFRGGRRAAGTAAEQVETRGKATQPSVARADARDGSAGDVPGATVAPAEGRALIALLASGFCLGATSMGSAGFFAILLTSNGFDHVLAASMASILGLSLTVSKGMAGHVYDLLGGKLATSVFLLIAVAGFTVSAFAGTAVTGVAIAAAILIGSGDAVGTVGVSMWSLDLSSPERRAKVIKDMQLAYQLGGFVFSLLPGLLMELVGNYTVSYVLMGVLSAVALVIMNRLYGRRA